MPLTKADLRRNQQRVTKAVAMGLAERFNMKVRVSCTIGDRIGQWPDYCITLHDVPRMPESERSRVLRYARNIVKEEEPLSAARIKFEERRFYLWGPRS